MKKIFSVLLLVIISVCYISCSPIGDTDGDLLIGVKNNGGSGGTGSGGGTGGSTNTGKVLSKVTTKDDNGNDLFINYLYSNKQLTGITTSDNSLKYTISYSGNTINKIVRVVSDSGQSITYIYDLVYKNSVLTSINEVDDFGGGFQNTGTIIYNYDSSGKISHANQKIYTDNAGTNILFSNLDFTTTYSGNNMSSYILKAVIGDGSATSGSSSITAELNSFSYDNKINPYSTLPKIFNIADIVGLGPNGLSSNNFTKATATTTTSLLIPPSTTPITSTTTQTSTSTYTYDSAGYAITQTTSGDTVKFEYINL